MEGRAAMSAYCSVCGGYHESTTGACIVTGTSLTCGTFPPHDYPGRIYELETANRTLRAALGEMDVRLAGVEAERDAARVALANVQEDIANWPTCEQHKPGKWDGDPPCVICEAEQQHKDLAALKARTCATCRFRERDYCLNEKVGSDLFEVECAVVKFCGAWAAKEQG
jgi:hypothetical protein